MKIQRRLLAKNSSRLNAHNCPPIVLNWKPMMSRPRRVGLPWFTREHYEALRLGLFDGDKLLVRYEAWRASTEQVEREVQYSGFEVVRVPIEPGTFLAWCEGAGLSADSAARSQYAAEALEL